MKKVVVIVGPTGIGKTDLSIKIAKHYNTEIISGDSVQVYRRLDIGSGKVLKDEMDGIKHHLIDILDPIEDYSVSDFQKNARFIIDELSKKEKLPIICGGTGYYINSDIIDEAGGWIFTGMTEDMEVTTYCEYHNIYMKY